MGVELLDINYQTTTLMKKLSSIAIIALAACAFQACQGPKDSKAAADSTNAVKDTTTTGAGIGVDKNDAIFAVNAANGGMTEIALSNMAVAKSINTKVRDFATMMVTDHSKAGDELKGIAQNKNITLPDSVDNNSKKAIDALSKVSVTNFDKAYVSQMIDDHKAAVKLFKDAAKNVKDPDLKAFADKTLLVIQSHLAAINDIHDGMK
jgi:putative membrane protein